MAPPRGPSSVLYSVRRHRLRCILFLSRAPVGDEALMRTRRRRSSFFHAHQSAAIPNPSRAPVGDKALMRTCRRRSSFFHAHRWAAILYPSRAPVGDKALMRTRRRRSSFFHARRSAAIPNPASAPVGDKALMRTVDHDPPSVTHIDRRQSQTRHAHLSMTSLLSVPVGNDPPSVTHVGRCDNPMPATSTRRRQSSFCHARSSATYGPSAGED